VATTTVDNTQPPAVGDASAPDQTEMAYPAETQMPPPVPPPVGQALEVPFQRYIVVDQFGYRPEHTKVAVLADPKSGWNAPDAYEPGSELEVRTWSDGKVVFKGAPTVWNGGAVDAAAGDRGSWFDFTPLKTAGLYYVFDPKTNGRSHAFSIGVDVYRPVLKTALRMFYFNRANVAKKAPFACVGRRCWTAAADNLGPGQDRDARSVTDRDNAKTARDFVGGWWDAGDTNKYVTFTNDAVHQLLTAYTERPSAFGDDFNIPESGNGLPDIIDEVLVELELLKKMQPADLKGGALIKVGYVDYAFPLPELSQLKRYYYPEPCSSATIVLAGEFAHAAIVLKKFPKLEKEAAGLADRAKKAWTFYHANPKSDACDDGTIKSGDADQTLEQQNQIAVTAAVYLFSLTGEAEYGDYVKKHYQVTRPFKDDLFSVYFPSQGDALLHYASLPNADPAVRTAIHAKKTALAKTSDIYGTKPERSLYRGYLRKDMFHWASNNARASAANTNYDLVQYELVSSAERAAFAERAADLLHWFHGVNAMQLVYLTNMYADGGDACADETYHAWFKDGHAKWDNARTSELGPAPGYLTGGPNLQYCGWQNPAEHACAKSPLRRQPAEKAYLDGNRGYEPESAFDKSWELTEPAIYYQASYVRLVSKFVD
jgi:endoglucanase